MPRLRLKVHADMTIRKATRRTVDCPHCGRDVVARYIDGEPEPTECPHCRRTFTPER